MANEMENKRKSRKVFRSAFTRSANELEAFLNVGTPHIESVQISWELLQEKFDGLRVVDSEIFELSLESASESELESELEGCEAYCKRFTALKLKCNKLLENVVNESNSSHSTGTGNTHNANSGMRTFKLPKIEFKHYDGSVKDWLGFWAQFKKIHDDISIDNHDKIEYLIQATVPGSRARQLVESYPIMSDNYQKIIDSMLSRFGREDLQIEFYVRELLKLVLTNSASKQKMDIATLYDKLETQLRSLDTLGISSDKCSSMLFPLIESCLPHELLRVWQRSTIFNSSAESEGDTVICPLEIRLKKLMSFLRQEVENEQRISLAIQGFGLSENVPSLRLSKVEGASNSRGGHLKRNIFRDPTAMGLMNSEIASCLFCSGSHDSEACFKAQKMPQEKKREVLSGKKACFRCLKVGHYTRRCRARIKCIVCGRGHSTIMCPGLPAHKKDEGQGDQQTGQGTQEHALTNQTRTHVFLQTLQVTLKGAKGSKVVRALLDSGSQRSYILRETAVQMGYTPKRREALVHCLFGGKEVPESHACYDITIVHENFVFKMEALDQGRICGDVTPVFNGPWTNELKALKIDILDGKPGPIELLLGADITGKLYTGGHQELACGLVAMETLIGWTLIGKIPVHQEHSDSVLTTLNLFVKNASISDLWELEAIGIKEPSEKQTREDMAKAAKQFFLQTLNVDQDGRYEVQLPWLEGHPPLPSNYNMAKRRIGSTISKLKGDGILEQYGQIFSEWEAEGIIEQVIQVDAGKNQGNYLPHRPVVKESSSTTKIRPVFDASAHEKGRPSINHCLEKGPNLIELIPSMLLRFRESKIGVVSDIRKAFLQIGISETDREFLKFLWIDSQGQEIVFRHKRVVFGLNSSPFLLGATLEYHLSRCFEKCDGNEASYSVNVVKRLSRSFYVDNCVTSLKDEESVLKFIRESVAIMAEGQFELRGWERTGDVSSNRTADVCSVLGLNWQPQQDTLVLNRSFLDDDLDISNMVVTKRKILSVAQKIFDPIGFVSPAVLLPKLLLQKLWENTITWDQPVNDVTANSFRCWMKELSYLFDIKIHRWIMAGEDEAENLSIHVFCDASQDAYACVIFLRAVLHGKVSVFLLASKARVAPIKKSGKKITIPRLELLAATIGARLFTHVKENLQKNIDCYFWSDSSTVISWIQREDEWGVFVWNRVVEIRQLTPVGKWRHLPGIHNPADLPSRGCSPKQLFQSKWWEGPKWLYDDPVSWPAISTTYDEEEINGERKKKLVITCLNVDNCCSWHLDYFSKYPKTVRMIAWIFRFAHNCKYPNEKRKGDLVADEQDFAENFILKLVQQEKFLGESDPKLGGLQPFYDKYGLIRLKSRVSNRKDTENYRFPVILPSKHVLVHSLIMFLHAQSCHVGTQGLLCLLREKYWILGGRRTVRSVINKCMVCRRYNAKPLVVQPPPLPLDRVRDAVAFEVTGIDFAGPLYLRNGEKVWVCLFTCAVFRAVHLELTTSMSTSCFLQALRRFVSRRGRPKTIYSDNGTNFVGAENTFSLLDWDTITRDTSVQRICWKFNPPTAAWWGGFWERLVGILKQLLRKVLGRASLNYEDLLTVLCECESIVNARPLTYLSDDSNDLVALTPSMFLREQVEYGVPDCDAVDNASLCRKLRKIQTLRQVLRVRFRAEYLGQLKLYCDKKSDRSISVGELVLVGNDNAKRLDWLTGRVVDVLPGKDGQVRLVKVKTAKGQLLRPVQRLYPLECYSVPEYESQDDVPDCGGRQQTEQPPLNEYGEAGYVNDPAAPASSSHEVQESASAGVSRVKTTRCGRVSKVPRRFL